MGKLALLGAGLCLALGGIPAAAATPLECPSPCAVHAEGWGYFTPVAEIRSGSEVHWTTNEVSHPTGEALETGDRCFVVAVGRSLPPTPVRFDVVGSTLEATTPAGTKACGTAIVIPSVGFGLAYHCLLHPYMKAVLVVTQ